MANKLDSFENLLDSEKVIIKNKSVLNFPDNLSEKNVSASRIKQSIASPVVGDTHSVIALLYELKDELETIFANYDDGTYPIDYANRAGSASKDALNRVINETYATLTELSNEIDKIKDGTYTTKKAEKDADGNTIKTTYGASLTKSLTGNTTQITLVINLLNKADEILATITQTIGSATSSYAGLMSATDKTRLDALYESFNDSDDNNIVDKVSELLALFENWSEGNDMATYLSTNYYNKTTMDTKLSAKEDVINKVTSVSASSTDDEYPSAKCVYDAIQDSLGNIEDALDAIIGEDEGE